MESTAQIVDQGRTPMTLMGQLIVPNAHRARTQMKMARSSVIYAVLDIIHKDTSPSARLATLEPLLVATEPPNASHVFRDFIRIFPVLNVYNVRPEIIHSGM